MVLFVRGWILRITICLILGVITTIAVAWGCALQQTFPPYYVTGFYFRPGGEWLWFIDRTDRPGACKLRWLTPFGDRRLGENEYNRGSSKHSQRRTLERLSQGQPDDRLQLWDRNDVPSWSKLGGTPDAKRDKEFRRVREEYAFGWPGLALGYRFESDAPGTNTRNRVIVYQYDPSLERYVGALHIGSSLPLTNWTGYLPLQVLWRGFVADSLLYAVGWFVPIGGIALARLGLRRYRGKCAKCGYDLRGDFSTGCAECGWGR